MPGFDEITALDHDVAINRLTETQKHEDREYLVEPLESFLPRVEYQRDVLSLLGRDRLRWPIFQHDAHSLAAFQTPVRDQGGRGSCYAFAAVAAIEAAYQRAYGLSLDLSEQYAFHINKAGELYGDYATSTTPHENNSSLWGFQGASDIIGKLQRSWLPTEADAPYTTQEALVAVAGDLDWSASQEQLDSVEFSEVNIPVAARWDCRYGVADWASLPDHSPAGIEQVLAADHEVIVDVDLRWRFDVAKGAYDYDPTSTGGGHCFLIVGYDRTAQTFEVKNSWGGSSLIHVTYDFVAHCVSGGTYVRSVLDPGTPAQPAAKWLGSWNMDHDGWRGRLVIRRHTDYRNLDPDAPTKLGSYYPASGGRRDVNGYFVDGGQGMVFFIADTDARVVPGTLTGQRFDVWDFSWDPGRAAGTTSWAGSPYGVVLRRDAIPGSAGGGFDVSWWLGSWAMNHDGWSGTLTWEQRTPLPFLGDLLTGTYTQPGRAPIPVSGLLTPGIPHQCQVSIAFDASNDQPFTLLHHTWERDVIAGTTQWGGRTFGVQAFRA